jgi:DNA-binding NarL/FixJ family response regulator
VDKLYSNDKIQDGNERGFPKTGMSAVNKPRIRVLVADDHPAVREGVAVFLAAASQRVKVVGTASDGREALRKALELRPDVVLLDICMPGQDGVATTEALRLQAPHIKVLIFSVYENQECVLRALQAGAHGYVSKRALPDELEQGIESVYSGQTFMSPQVAQTAVAEFVKNGRAGHLPSDLSHREREVLVCIASGLKNNQIATQLGISVSTIETHRERIMRRLNIHCVAGLTKFALATGIIPLEGNAIAWFRLASSRARTV